MEKVKKMKCYKRLKYQQYVQVSGLSGTQFLSYLPKRFTHLYSLRSKRFRASSSRKLGRELSIFFLLPLQISRYNSNGNAYYAG